MGRVLGLLVGVIVVVVDQIAKREALAALSDGPVTVIDGVLGFRLTFNTGAAFSTATTMTEVLTVLATVVSVIVIVAIVRAHSTSWALVLGLLLGGAAGNLVDRLVREPGFGRGAVVDYVELRFVTFPVFNIADISITLAAVSIVLMTMRGVPYRADRRTR
jgi:signal peptidase II